MTKTQLLTSAEQVVGVFTLALLGAVIASGTGVFSIATWESAAAAGVAAGLKAIDALLGHAVSGGSTSIVSAVHARRAATRAATKNPASPHVP